MQQAVPLLQDDGVTLVLSGDVPLIQADTLQALLTLCGGQALALLSLNTPQPQGMDALFVMHNNKSPPSLKTAMPVQHKN
jgi:bifunctional N-acetylglucosamine-1-phosphate-uridyltransferase/glucosamine-1-phosphate-acetyltransferase GlmU-like protein